jgi:hypothetical protein
LKRTRTSLTKEVVKNYFSKFSALIIRWAMFCGKPVIVPLQCQVVFQSLIKQCTLVLKINVQSFSKCDGRTRALLSEPEGMFKTDEDG